MTPSLAGALCKAVAGGDSAQLEVMRRLNRDLAAAKDRIEELESLIGLKPSMPSALGLTAQMSDILGLILAAQGVVTVSMIETALFGGRPFSDWPSWPRKVIFVQMKRLRDVLEKHAIKIERCTASDGSRGYFMSHQHKSHMRALIASPILNDVASADQPSCNCAPPDEQPLRRGGAVLPLGQAS